MGAAKSFARCLIALLLALSAASVRADSSALVTFSGIDIALFDLAPGDGIDPAVSLNQLERSGAVFQYQNPDGGWPPLREERINGAGAATLADANGSATAVLGAGPMRGESVATGVGAFTALLTDSFRFTLTPHTRVVFSAVTESALVAETAQAALAVITLEGRAVNLGESITFETSSVRGDSGSGVVPLAVETASSSLALVGDISLRGYAFASSVSPVPEPGPLALLLGGGLVLLAAGRRRHRPAGAIAHGTYKCPLRSVRRLVRIAAASLLSLGGAVWPGIVQASSGSASIVDFYYELFDLAPDDGIAPALVLTSESFLGSVHANRNTFLGNPWDESRELTGYGAASIIELPGSATVELSPDAASVSALAWRGAFAASARSAYDFTLTPMTQVVFSAIGDLRVAHDPSNRPDASQASAGLSGEITGSPGQRTQFSSFVSLDTPGETRRSLAVHAFTGDLAGAGSVRLDANTFAVGVSPIPEPSFGSMLAVGVLLGWTLSLVLHWSRGRLRSKSINLRSRGLLRGIGMARRATSFPILEPSSRLPPRLSISSTPDRPASLGFRGDLVRGFSLRTENALYTSKRLIPGSCARGRDSRWMRWQFKRCARRYSIVPGCGQYSCAGDHASRECRR